MAEAVAAAAAVAQLLTTLPDIGRKLVRWQDVRSENPIRLPALLEDITDCQNVLTTVMSIYENLERDPSVQLPHTAPIVKLQVSKLQRNLDRAKQDCERLNPSRKTFLLYPNELRNKITSVAEDVDKLNIAMGELKHDLQPQPVSGPWTSQHDRFIVVNNVPHNPPDVYLDFASKDENGNPRTHEAQLKNAIFDQGDRSAIGAVARGGGGVGKTCALRGIGLLEETKKIFTGGTLYMTIGADGGLSRLIESIAEIVEKAGSKQRADRIRYKNTLSEATSVAGEWFQHAACLFVIDDVWCVNGITRESVHELSNLARLEESRVAFSARDTDVDCGRRILFEERSQCGENARCILLRCADMQPPTSTETSEAFNRILQLCNGLPVALSVCGRAVKHFAQFRCVSCPENAWKKYWESRKHRPVLYSDKGSAENMKESVLLSLGFIDEDLDMSMSETWYRGLCVLRNQQFVPNDVLCRLWRISSETSNEFVGRLERFGIAQIHYGGPDEEMMIGLHDVLLDISRELAAESDEVWQWSTTLIASYANSSCCNTSQSDRRSEVFDGFQEWWMGVEDDGYIFRNICRLLMIGKCEENLLWMMTSAEWIIKQLLKNGHRQVQEDIKAATEYLVETCREDERTKWEQVQAFLKALHNAVQLSAKRVRESEWIGMAWFEVYGRLVHLQKKNEAVRKFLQKVQDKAPRPWLKPSAGYLAPAGESLRYVMELESEPLCQTEVKSMVLACYEDAGTVYIKRYDTQTGVESSPHIVLSGISKVSCAAFSLPGKYLAVVLDDGRIVICNLCSSAVTVIHKHSGNSRQPERSEAGGEGERSEEGESMKCGIMGWRHILGCVCALKKERGESREVEGDRNYEGGNSDEGLGRGSSGDKDACSRYEVEYVSGNIEGVRSVAVSNDGRHVVSGYRDGIVRVWEEEGDEWVGAVRYGHDDIVYCVSMNENGTRVASGSHDNTVRVWEKDGDEWVGAVLHGHEDIVQCVSMSREGTRVASGSHDQTVRVWEKDGDKWVSAILHGHEYTVLCVSMNGDGTRIASGSGDNTVCVWEKDGDNWASAVLHGHDGRVRCVSMNGDGTRVASGSHVKTVCVWEKDGEKWVSAVLHGHDDLVRCVSMNRDGTRVASGSEDQTVRVWEKDGEKWVSAALHGHEDTVRSVSMNEDSTRVVSASDDKTVRVWEKDGNEWASAVLHGHDHRVNCVSMNGDGTRVASGSQDHTVRVWEKDGDKWVSTVLHGHDDFVASVWMSRDGQHVVSKDRGNKSLSWRKRGEQWVTADDGVGDLPLAGSHAADEDVWWRGRVSHDLLDEAIRPLAWYFCPAAFRYFITMRRKPYIAQIDVIR